MGIYDIPVKIMSRTEKRNNIKLKVMFFSV